MIKKRIVCFIKETRAKNTMTLEATFETAIITPGEMNYEGDRGEGSVIEQAEFVLCVLDEFSTGLSARKRATGATICYQYLLPNQISFAIITAYRVPENRCIRIYRIDS